METVTQTSGTKPKVVIIGGGFGGLYAAKALANQVVEVILIDRTNHHLFQPLLYQVATAGLSPGDIAQPIRHILRDAKNISVIMAGVEGIDPVAKVVRTTTRDYPYDFLIVATGARHSYFGHDDWEMFAPGLKSLPDALELRRRILLAFETAETARDESSLQAALTFVVIGAGPTGVEMAGAISELAKRTLVDDFRQIRTGHARIILLDAAPRVLPTFTPGLSKSAHEQLKQMEVEVRVGTKVLNVTGEGVQLENEFISARTVIWAAGNSASPLAKQLGGETDRQGRILVNQDLSVPGHPQIFAVGDMTNFSHQTGQPLPGVAPVAMQMGAHAARNILELAQGQPSKRFKYFNKGNMATIGRNKGVADLNVIRFGGVAAWMSWLLVHLVFLVGLRNRIQVFIQWIWAYFTYARGARLIYGPFKPAVPPAEQRATNER
ncbi:MAG: NAD(P)/FAD-dependent oxidoreductase [Verrucomicrobia bacterium]|jgi:NADH:ubiquinone reductase (H+-translocating)|nr:NAD(P)/FAD-dependent oxidoreductase [Verrucomicrobiota bacterium]